MRRCAELRLLRVPSLLVRLGLNSLGCHAAVFFARSSSCLPPPQPRLPLPGVTLAEALPFGRSQKRVRSGNRHLDCPLHGAHRRSAGWMERRSTTPPSLFDCPGAKSSNTLPFGLVATATSRHCLQIPMFYEKDDDPLHRKFLGCCNTGCCYRFGNMLQP